MEMSGADNTSKGVESGTLYEAASPSLCCLSLNYNRIYEQCVSALSGPFEPEQPKQLQPLSCLLLPCCFPQNMHCHSATIQGKGVGGQGHSFIMPRLRRLAAYVRSPCNSGRAERKPLPGCCVQPLPLLLPLLPFVSCCWVAVGDWRRLT